MTRFMICQVVWARGRGEIGGWFPAVVIDKNDGWVGLEQNKPAHAYVLWLGDGRVSQVPVSVLRDFCQGYAECCYSNMPREFRYDSATHIAVKLTAARADEHIEDDQKWETWAMENMHRFKELSVTRSFYITLQRKHSSSSDDSGIEN